MEKLVIYTSNGTILGTFYRHSSGALNLISDVPETLELGLKLKKAINAIISQDNLLLKEGKEERVGSIVRNITLGKRCSKDDPDYLKAVKYQLRRNYGFRSKIM